MDIQTVTALIDTQGPDITGNVVSMPAGSTHYVTGKDARDFYSHHPDTFTVGSEYDTVLDRHAAEHQELFSGAPESATYTDVTTDDATLTAIDATVFSATIVDAFIYDTAKDSDGGAWRHRCGHTSWEAETLSGNWLGSAANEAAARAISGATTGSYYYDTTALGFYTLNAGSGKTATYRGNVAKFPALPIGTAEASRVVVWDGTQADVPMWRVFDYAGKTITAIAMLNGQLVVATTTGVFVENLAADDIGNAEKYTTATTPAIVNNSCNDVAMTVLPGAPLDVATGLPVPTIDVFTAGGLSRIKDDGTVVNSTNSAGSTTYYPLSGITRKDRIAMALAATCNVHIGPGITTTGSGNPQPGFTAYTNISTPAILTSTISPSKLVAHRNYAEWSLGGANGVTRLLENPGSVAAGMVAYVTKDYNSGWQVGAIKGAWLADTTAEVVTGSELVTNGDFATDVTGWTKQGAGTVVWDAAGVMSITNDGSGADHTVAYQAITCVVGKTYVIGFEVTAVTVQGNIGVGTGAFSGQIAGNSALAVGKGMLSFVATATTHYIWFSRGTTTASANTKVDNITCRLAVPDRSVKAKGLQVFGSITKSAVASGAELVGYSGFSAANYFEQPYNADLDFGTGDFCIMGWARVTADDIGALFSRSLPGSAGGLALLIANGTLAITLYGSATTSFVQIAPTTTGLSLNRWGFVCVGRRSGSAFTSIDANAENTSADSTNLTYASTVLRLGQRSDADRPFKGDLALWRFSATAPSAEQIAKTYRDELPLFQANAACTLAGSSNAVTALAYDEDTDLLHVGTSYGRSTFKGLERIASEATAVGSIAALSAVGGIIAQGGATAVDVYVPAMNLREELNRAAEQKKAFGQALVAHDFTATASQTTFTLPVGWEIVAVYQQGSIKRETTSWTRSFDGFKWSAVLGTGATVSDWISILAKRV